MPAKRTTAGRKVSQKHPRAGERASVPRSRKRAAKPDVGAPEVEADLEELPEEAEGAAEVEADGEPGEPDMDGDREAELAMASGDLDVPDAVPVGDAADVAGVPEGDADEAVPTDLP